jgi:biopolymer transport protein TolR
MGEINVVPYIDVMLVLLIIFMITAPLLKEGVKVDLPDAGAQTAALLRRDPLTPVLVKADTTVPYGTVVRAMVLLQHAGAAKVGFLTDPPKPVPVSGAR